MSSDPVCEKTLDPILAFCITSALGCMKEPPIYGALRLLECMSLLISYDQSWKTEKDLFLGSLQRSIDENKLLCMEDETAFRQFLIETAESLLDRESNQTETGRN